ncbi:MAG: four helix bundle protein [Candidatus Zambryskibacteria bacterium RIFOXYD1_FULL_40_13]|nr:MAG: 30S ribosomal protein S23 [Parcubacteria group bacterium GW2011_GWC1_39_12]KKR19458.1 MAG: S23 ribosomal protein [Parcubacteria group bacterium GW2011_GWF1_39_37]KKR35084.1 MAG: S23 ribosomal protein [Parcubacteria group bacterium GW2011_GWC2_40_10]KKR52407.1 MAG: S23 ribosomal protein [Parcubacteria group bacterium GW2011_GWE1_40_20]KKR64849.1 MAG: S23 ribosomal protein [Parcubacteria group bacterium GW2011_GWB1_40_5]KKR69471.1 MAG: S23 ribosomal protein [Parcubacteria group bacterium
MKIERFEDIIAWQKGKMLAVDIYECFKPCKDFSFRDQIQRAVISISNNIAEGFERQSNKELSKFLFIAKGSCAEVRSMLYIALELKYITKKDFKGFYLTSQEISKILSGLIKTL